MALTYEGDRGPDGAAKAPIGSTIIGKRWSDKGIFARIMIGLTTEASEEKTVMIDATYLKTHRTATSMGVRKGGVDV